MQSEITEHAHTTGCFYWPQNFIFLIYVNNRKSLDDGNQTDVCTKDDRSSLLEPWLLSVTGQSLMTAQFAQCQNMRVQYSIHIYLNT